MSFPIYRTLFVNHILASVPHQTHQKLSVGEISLSYSHARVFGFVVFYDDSNLLLDDGTAVIRVNISKSGMYTPAVGDVVDVSGEVLRLKGTPFIAAESVILKNEPEEEPLWDLNVVEAFSFFSESSAANDEFKKQTVAGCSLCSWIPTEEVKPKIESKQNETLRQPSSTKRDVDTCYQRASEDVTETKRPRTDSLPPSSTCSETTLAPVYISTQNQNELMERVLIVLDIARGSDLQEIQSKTRYELAALERALLTLEEQGLVEQHDGLFYKVDMSDIWSQGE